MMNGGGLHSRMADIQRSNQATLQQARSRAAQRGLSPPTPQTAPRVNGHAAAAPEVRANGSCWSGLPMSGPPLRLPDARSLAELNQMSEQITQQLYVGLQPQHPDARSRNACLLYTSPSPRDRQKSRMPSSA